MSKKLTTKEFIEKAIAKHGNKYDYSLTEYVRSRDKVKIICLKHGMFEQRASSHLSGNGCPECQKEWTDEHRQNLAESSRRSRGFTTKQWIEIAKNVHGGKYDYSLVDYINQRTKVKIVCSIHGEFMQNADSHIRGAGCPQCGLTTDAVRNVDHTWTDEQRSKIENTCLIKYGAKRYLDSNEGRNQLRRIFRSEVYRQKMRQIIASAEVQQKTKNTNLARYGVTYPAKLPSVCDKIYQTKRKNHTVSSSRAEIIANEILSNEFSKDNVVHQYKDKIRYPYACDFYIKSLDLFIEFNLHWSHGKHFFKNNASDLEILNQWKAKAINSSYYRSVIDVWTVRDIAKRDTAIKNKLNYLVFWYNDLSDFYEWLNQYKQGNIILNNID